MSTNAGHGYHPATHISGTQNKSLHSLPYTEPSGEQQPHSPQWQQWIDDGLFKNVTELAAHLGRDRARVSHTLQLALLSPEIIHLVIIGALPNHITLRIVNRSFPADWEEQKKFFGIQ